MRILMEELKTKNIETLSPPVSSLTLLFLFFVLFFWYLVYPPLPPLIRHWYLFVCLSFRYFLFCFPDIWFIPLCHPSSPPLSGYDAHPCRDRPKSTEAIYYTLCKMCTHVFILTYITNIHRSAWAKKVESTHVVVKIMLITSLHLIRPWTLNSAWM